MQTWSYPERHPVGPGPWEHEPDKAQWVDETTDLDCLAVRAHHGAWCGYVGVPPGHPYYDRDYDDVPAQVHGGLTYAARCREGEPEPTVCHVPLPGRAAEVFWLGFDCNHAFDLAPIVEQELAKHSITLGSKTYATYRTFDYVRAQIHDLALQLAAAEPS